MVEADKDVSRLLILSCSKQKNSKSELLPALERYDGPNFRVVRRYLQEIQVTSAKATILILSAKFGLIEASQPIPDYDQIMIGLLEEKLAQAANSKLSEVFEETRALSVRLQMSQTYLVALYQAFPLLKNYPLLSVAAGTPGQRLAGLKQWLCNDALPPPTDARPGKRATSDFQVSKEQLKIAVNLWRDQPQPKDGFWVAIIDGEAVGAKWLIAYLTKKSVSSFHTDYARRALSQAGFTVQFLAPFNQENLT